MKLIPIFLLMTFCLGAINVNAQSKPMSKYDKDGDSRLTEDEFDEMLKKRKVFDTWDTNNNGFISLQEWTDGVKKYYPDMKNAGTYANYLKWDMNADHYLNDDEFYRGNFLFWDTDKSEYVEAGEWDNQYSGWSSIK